MVAWCCGLAEIKGSQMRQVGKRREAEVVEVATEDHLLAGASFIESISSLAGGSSFVPKGLYRFKSHDQAQAMNDKWLAIGMARIAMEREHG